MSARDSSHLDNFTKTNHTKPTPALDPSSVKLSRPFVVCVIGATGAIGEGIALAYARAGASGIIITSRSVDSLDGLGIKIVKINPRIKVLADECDLTSSSSVAKLAENIKTAFGRLDVAVLGQGYSGPVTTRITDGDPDIFAAVTAVNYTGTYHAAHYLLPLLLSTPEGAQAFIAVGSFAAAIVDGPIANTQYCVSKTAQAKMMEHIAVQYGKEGALVLSIHPGAVATKGALDTAPEVFMKCKRQTSTRRRKVTDA